MSSTGEQRLSLVKGKGKATSPEASERTPLLASQSDPSQEQPEPTNARRRLWSRLAFVFLVSLFLCFLIFVFLALLGYSYAARALAVSPDDLLNHGLVLKGPDRVDVLNVTQDGRIWIELEAKVGLDAGVIVGVNSDESDSIWRATWKSIGRWGIGRVDMVSINLSTIRISHGNDTGTVLAAVEVEPLQMSLSTNPPPDESWLTTVSTPILITPTQNSTAMVQFIRDCWREGSIGVHMNLRRAVVHGGGLDDQSWRRRFNSERSDIQMEIHMKIPPLPGLPSPGRNTPFPSLPQLITMQTFSVSSDSTSLSLHAQATIIDPAPPTFNFTSPNVPFVVSIPSEDSLLIPLASVHTQPFSLTHPNITIVISGKVLPLPSSSSPVLSAFISRYFSAEPSPIVISSPTLPGINLDTIFPAPSTKPQVLRNVTIHNMRIRTTASGTFLASGTVYARAVLPKGVNVKLDVNQVLPDVLVFDGEVPDSVHFPVHDNKTVPPAPPLPVPLPERAFGHIRPTDWLPSSCTPDQPEEGEGSVYVVTADMVDTPLQVLPGRKKELSNFLAKVVFGNQGAVAGLLGSAAVTVSIHGLPVDDGTDGEIELIGLPFRGSVRVGKKGLLIDDIQRWTQEYMY